MSFRHRLVVGVTGSGKSYKAKIWAKGVLKAKACVVAFNPVGDTWPKGVINCRTADELEALLRRLIAKKVKVMLFLDEAFMLRQQVNRKLHPLLTIIGSAGRHYGITMVVISQYPTSIDTNLRWNCSEAYVFRLADVTAAKELWKQYGRQSIGGRPVWEVILALKPRQHLILTADSAKLVTA